MMKKTLTLSLIILTRLSFGAGDESPQFLPKAGMKRSISSVPNCLDEDNARRPRVEEEEVILIPDSEVKKTGRRKLSKSSKRKVFPAKLSKPAAAKSPELEKAESKRSRKAAMVSSKTKKPRPELLKSSVSSKEKDEGKYKKESSSKSSVSELERLRFAAQIGDITTKTTYAKALYEKGMEDNNDELIRQAIVIVKKAAELGDMVAENNYAYVLLLGHCGPGKLEEALEYFRRSASKGYTLAMFHYAGMLITYFDGPENLRKAVRLCRQIMFITDNYNRLEFEQAKDLLGIALSKIEKIEKEGSSKK